MSRFRRNRLAELQVDGRVIRQHEIEASRNGICRRRRRGFVISGPRPRGLRRGAKRRLSVGPVFEQDKAPFPYVSGFPVGGTHAEETLVAPGDLNLLAALQSPYHFHGRDGAVEIRVVAPARAGDLTEMLRACQDREEKKEGSEEILCTEPHDAPASPREWKRHLLIPAQNRPRRKAKDRGLCAKRYDRSRNAMLGLGLRLVPGCAHCAATWL